MATTIRRRKGDAHTRESDWTVTFNSTLPSLLADAAAAYLRLGGEPLPPEFWVWLDDWLTTCNKDFNLFRERWGDKTLEVFYLAGQEFRRFTQTCKKRYMPEKVDPLRTPCF